MKKLFGILRILMGFIFFWTFWDKLFGLGFSTERVNAWINGGSPTYNFLHNTNGTFAFIFRSLAGLPTVDWLFMIGLFGIGLALILGIGMRIASITGSILLALMYLAVFPIKNNLILDDHIIYIVVLCCLYVGHAGRYWGFGQLWSRNKWIKKHTFFE